MVSSSGRLQARACCPFRSLSDAWRPEGSAGPGAGRSGGDRESSCGGKALRDRRATQALPGTRVPNDQAGCLGQQPSPILGVGARVTAPSALACASCHAREL